MKRLPDDLDKLVISFERCKILRTNHESETIDISVLGEVFTVPQGCVYKRGTRAYQPVHVSICNDTWELVRYYMDTIADFELARLKDKLDQL